MKNLYYLTTLSISAFLLIFTASCGGDTTATPGDSAIEAAENFSADSGPSAAEQACIDTYESDKAAAISTYESSSEYKANKDAITAYNKANSAVTTAQGDVDTKQKAYDDASGFSKLGAGVTLAAAKATLATKKQARTAANAVKSAKAALLAPVTASHNTALATLDSIKEECIAGAGTADKAAEIEALEDLGTSYTFYQYVDGLDADDALALQKRFEALNLTADERRWDFHQYDDKKLYLDKSVKIRTADGQKALLKDYILGTGLFQGDGSEVDFYRQITASQGDAANLNFQCKRYRISGYTLPSAVVAALSIVNGGPSMIDLLTIDDVIKICDDAVPE